MNVARRIVASLCLLVCAAAPALADSSKLDPLARRALARVRAGSTLESLRESGVAVGPAREIDVFIVGSASRAELEAVGAIVRTALPGVSTAYVPAALLERVAALPGVRRIEGAPLVEPVLNASVPTTAASFQRGPGPNFTGVNGAGVLVGVVDTGVDWHHGDFKNPDGTTRLVNIWDQTDAVGPAPAGFAYGTQWTSADIDLGLPRETDPDEHGTHVLGIAGGDGSATGGAVPAFTYVGMAPKADLIMVKTSFTGTGILDGVAYVMNRATALGKNAVVNLSLGTLSGPKDGTSGFETGLNALVAPGHIVVCAAGNDRGKPVHAESIAPASGIGTITQSLQSTTTSARVSIDGYYESGENLSLTLTTPNGTVIGPVPFGASNAPYPGQLTPSGRVYFENGVSLTATGDREVYVEIVVPSPNPTAANPGGGWTYQFSNPAGHPVEIDLWTYYRTIAANFTIGNQPDEELVIEPANAPDVITAAAWITKNEWVDCADRPNGYGSAWPVGAIALFSAPGPTRDGRQKPDIAAPGIGIGAALSSDMAPACLPTEPDLLLNDGMQHFINAGTSMSAPHVAGAVALILQKYGALTAAQVKTILFDRAVVDSWTGATWNKDFGHGKLSVGDLTDPLAHVASPNGGEALAIGSTASLAWSASDAYRGVTGVDLELRRSESGSFETIATGVPNTGSYDWTVGGPPTAEARLRVTARDSTGNAGVDLSDAVFTITAAVATPSGDAIADFALDLRSPNPAPGAVDVEFAVPHAARVSVTVFDLAGRHLATLAHGPHAAGRYHARWSATASGAGASGIYFVKLESEGRTLTRRIAIAR